MKLYRNIALPELYVLYKTGKIYPTVFPGGKDSLAPEGVWSFWLDEKRLVTNYTDAVVSIEYDKAYHSLMYFTVTNASYATTNDECVIDEYLIDEPVTPTSIKICSVLNPDIPFDIEEDFPGMSIEGDLWDDMEGFISWIKAQDSFEPWEIPSVTWGMT